MLELLGVKVPVPEADHVAPADMLNDPARLIVPLFAHTVWSVPASAVGAGEIFIVVVFNTELHPPLLVVVKVRVTTPAEISALPGM